MANGLDAGDSLRRSDKFKFFRGNKTDSSAGERYVPFEDLFTLLTNEGIGGGGDVSSEDIARLEQNIGLNSLRDAVNGGWAWFNMVDGIADVFTDETGVNTGGASNATYDAASDYYYPTISDPATLLISSDTTDGSTSFIDEAGSKTVTANGDVQHDTDQAQFGASSILFDGTGDYLSLSDSSDWDFGNGDFTIDAWIRPSTVAGTQVIASQWNVGQISFSFYLSAAALSFQYSTNGSTAAATITGGTVSALAWTHVAVVRNGNTINLYVGGTSVASGDVTGVTFFNSNHDLDIGVYQSGLSPYAGHIDEFRLAKGSAAWTGNFTPPAAPYDPTPNNMTLPSIEFTTQQASPASARSVVLYDPIDAVTLNTDLILEFSRDSGTTWTAATLEADAVFSGDVLILVTDDIDISAQPAGTGSIIWRIRTANQVDVQIHGVYLQWR